ncbi:hypothetical protein ACWDTP_38135 [Mycobacterium sp. NPDC003449]
MDRPDIAQARQLIGELRAQIRDMTPRLARAEQEGAGHTTRARAMRREAAELRRDVGQARFLIDRLHRRFPDIESSEAG